jgi:hypothetical protein
MGRRRAVDSCQRSRPSADNRNIAAALFLSGEPHRLPVRGGQIMRFLCLLTGGDADATPFTHDERRAEKILQDRQPVEALHVARRVAALEMD